ncbi:DtxR family transcriptional regulator [bacterium]|nr:DtxR family transcriptional regulator [bacterium]
MKIGTVSESLEDYLLIIHQLRQSDGQARVKEIAEKKGVKMSSVSAALKRLSREKLINYTAREVVDITPAGEGLVRRLLTRHEQVSRFLKNILGVSIKAAQQDAHGIEHHVSLETTDRLAAFLCFIEKGPGAQYDIAKHFTRYYNQCLEGVPASASTAEITERVRQICLDREEESLLDLQPGERAVVKRILAKSAIRQRLVDMGFLPNVVITMERVAPLGDPIEVKIKGFHVSLRNEEAARILIERIVSSDK